MDEEITFHVCPKEWDSLSKKRFSPGRLHSIWHDLDGQTRRRYRQLSTRAEEATGAAFDVKTERSTCLQVGRRRID